MPVVLAVHGENVTAAHESSEPCQRITPGPMPSGRFDHFGEVPSDPPPAQRRLDRDPEVARRLLSSGAVANVLRRVRRVSWEHIERWHHRRHAASRSGADGIVQQSRGRRHPVRKYTAVLASLGLMFVSGLSGWAIGKTADRAVSMATDDGPVGIDVEWSSGSKLLVPEGAVSQLPHPSWTYPEWDSKVYAIGGVDVRHITRFYLYGEAETPVVINSISAVQVNCEPASDGWIEVSPGAGGALPDLMLAIDLHSGKDTAIGTPVGQGASGDSWDFPRSVSQSEIERYLAMVQPPPSDICSYRLSIHYRSDGKEGVRLVDDDGEPFRAAGEGIADKTITAD